MDYTRYSESIMRMVMPQPFPLGVKIIKQDDLFPDEVVRPSKFGIKVALCQWITLARRWGWDGCNGRRYQLFALFGRIWLQETPGQS